MVLHRHGRDRRCRLQAAFTALAKIPKPAVAAITGYALGGGLELALAADFRVARRQQPARPARDPPRHHPRCWRDPAAAAADRRRTGQGPDLHRSRCRGRRGAADRAGRPRSSRRTTCYDAAVAMAGQFAHGPALALRAAKEAIDRGLSVDLDTGLEYRADAVRVAVRHRDREIGHALVHRERSGPGRVRAAHDRPRHDYPRSGIGARGRRRQAGQRRCTTTGRPTTYDAKWSISFDRAVHRLRPRPVRARRRATTAGRTRDALEIGCGTGFFLLNLWQAGVLDARVDVTDISPGHGRAARRNAERLGLDVGGRWPTPSAAVRRRQFDLVVGHAVLHHIPDVELALREVLRVLRPGGRFVFAGEPTRHGDFVARRLSRLTWEAATRADAAGRRCASAGPGRVDELPHPSEAAAAGGCRRPAHVRPRPTRPHRLRAGAVDVRTVTEELTASWFGWPVRTFEYAVNRDALGWGWAMFAYRGLAAAVARSTETSLARVVPARLFYNVSVTRPEALRCPRAIPRQARFLTWASCAGSCATGRGPRATWCATGASRGLAAAAPDS